MCKECLHPTADDILTEGYTKKDLFALADEIGGKVERGDLPPKDENGFYILP